jgi:aldose 1-epimerase
MYQVKAKTFGTFKVYHVFNKQNQNEVVIAPEFGATVLQIRLKGQDLLDPYPTPVDLQNLSWARNSILIPYPNRIRDGKYDWKGNTYFFPINNAATQNSIHGFVRALESSVLNISLNNDFATIKCKIVYNGDNPGYPWPFETLISYRISNDKGFEVTLEVHNLSKEEIPLGLGWHPYFRLGGKIENWKLDVPECKKIMVDEKMIPTGDTEDFRFHGSVDKHRWDTCFFKNEPAIIEIKVENERGILNIWQNGEQWPFFQIFTPPNGECIALEPMSCNIDAFNNNDHLIRLEAGKNWSGRFGFSFERNS